MELGSMVRSAIPASEPWLEALLAYGKHVCVHSHTFLHCIYLNVILDIL